jgi:capsid portal protein
LSKSNLQQKKDYKPAQHKWMTDEQGKQTNVEVAKRVTRWWTASVDGKINIVGRYGNKPLEITKGKNTIELASEAEVAETVCKLREAAELGE